jgi:monovalent cation:H+ antiporter-2, CPA2 family
LPESDTVVDKTIGELRIRSSTGASIVAVVRGEEVMPNPGPEVALRAGDLVGVLGTPDQRTAFRELTNGP